ncbi:hypothetical protein [Streptomyces sp. NPDC058861]|uniref:hypothetical protein n=1 Tax=Streptomyces sp. NPDC058861 TaxID=3346653 RepID=UPI00368459EB
MLSHPHPGSSSDPVTSDVEPATMRRLDAEEAVTHAVDKIVGAAPVHPALTAAWSSWRSVVDDLIHSGCRAVGIDQADAVRGAITAVGYQRRTTGSLHDEVEALTAAGAWWHDTPQGVFWTDADQEI